MMVGRAAGWIGWAPFDGIGLYGNVRDVGPRYARNRTGHVSLYIYIHPLCCILTFFFSLGGSRLADWFMHTLRYGGVMRATAGPRVAWLTDAVILVFLYGVLIVYCQVCAEIFVDILNGYGVSPIDETTKPYFDNRRLFVLVFSVCGFWPLSLFLTLYRLRWVSVVATVAMMFVVIAVITKAAVETESGDVCMVKSTDPNIQNCGQALPPRSTSFMQFANAFSAFSFAFTTHTAIPPILAELKDASAKRSMNVIVVITWFSFAVYLSLGLAGYAIYVHYKSFPS